MGFGLGNLGGIGRLGKPALNEGGGFTLASLFANGEDGFLFGAFDELDELNTVYLGNAVAIAADADPVGLAFDDRTWGSLRYADKIAAQAELRAGFAVASVGSPPVAATYDTGTGQGTASRGASGADMSGVSLGSLTSTKQYLIDIENTGASPISVRTSAIDGSIASTITAGVRQNVNLTTFTSYAVAPTVNSTSITFTIHSMKEVPGNRAVQATSTKRPLWKANSGKPYIVGDKVDDVVTTGFIPTSALTFAIAVNFPSKTATTYALSGGASTGNKRAGIGIALTTGALTIGWGGLVGETGSPDRSGANMVVIVAGSGFERDVYIDGALASFAAPGGVGPDGTGGGFSLCAFNSSGANSLYSDALIYGALAVNRRVTANEIAGINTLLQRTF